MSGFVQLGDIVKAVELFLWIKENCFSNIRNASTLYLGFKQDVLNLGNRLQEFHAVIERALRQIETDPDRHALLKFEADELFGNFRVTLNDCEKLLRRHFKLNGDRATALDNGFWKVNTQPEVDELRRRLQAHQYKIQLFLEPLELDLLCGMQGNVHEILALMRNQAGLSNAAQLPEIPRALRQRFDLAFQRNAPETVEELCMIPLQPGIDALSLHYRECIYQSDNLGLGPSQQQNLSLVKAHWLYETLESSDALQASRPGSLFRRIVEQLGQKVESQYKKRKIHHLPDHIFVGLDDAAFALWPHIEVVQPPKLTDLGEGEVELVHVPLTSPHSTQSLELYVIRVSDKMLRIVEELSSLDGFTRNFTGHSISLNVDRFIPLYAVALGNEDKGIINLTHSSGAGLLSYDFQSRDSVLKVQDAFTGYKTVSVSTWITCSVIYKSGSWKNVRDLKGEGVGEVQLWQLPGDSDTIGDPLSPSTSTLGSIYSSYASSEYSMASQAFSGIDKSVVTIVPSKIGTEGAVVKLELPEPPLLVAMMKCVDGTYSIWQTDLSKLVIGLARKVKNGYRTTVRMPKVNDTFPGKRLGASQSQLNLWDLPSLLRPSNPAKQKGKDKKIPAVEELGVKSIDFEFSSVEACNRFRRHFMKVSNDRCEEFKQYAAAHRIVESEASRPRDVDRSGYPEIRSRNNSEFSMSARERAMTGSNWSEKSYVLDPIARFSVLDLKKAP